MEVNLIILKNMSKDSNGLPKYLFATDKQVEYICNLRNNPEKRYNFIKLGNYIFSPIDILYIEGRSDYGGAVPKYYFDRYNEEKKLNTTNRVELVESLS